MKIGIISTMNGSSWGGSEELWYDLVKQNTNHDYIILRHFNPNTPQKLSIIKSSQVQVKQLPKRYNLANKIFKVFLRTTSNLKSLIGTIVKQTNPYKQFKNCDFIIINQGGTYDVMYDLYLMDLIKHKYCKNIFLICHWNTDYGKPVYLDYAITKTYYKSLTGIFFVSERNKQTTERQLAVKLKNAFIIKNPINRSHTNKIQYPSVKTNYILSSVGRLDITCKGQDILIEVLSKKKWINRNWELRLYGRGKDKEYLQDLINYYNLQNKVFLKGHKNIDKIWSESHLLVLPSLSEGLPLTLIEAMICGRSAVVTHIAGMPQLIHNGINGFIAEAPKDIFLDKTLEKAWQQRNSWAFLGEKAREQALDYFEVNAGNFFLNKILQILDDN